MLNNPLRYTDPTGLAPNDASKQLSEEPDDASGGPDDGCPDCAFEVQMEEVVVTAEREGQDGPSMPAIHKTLGGFGGAHVRTVGTSLLMEAKNIGRRAPGRVHLEAMGAFAKGSGYGLAVASATYDIYKNPTERNAIVTVVSTGAGVGATILVCSSGVGTVGCVVGGTLVGGSVGIGVDELGGEYLYGPTVHAIDKVRGSIEEAIPGKGGSFENR